MKRNRSLTIFAALTAGHLYGVALAQAAEFKLPEADATPAELVDAALRSELDGPSDLRETLLDRALKLDPNFAPARWQSGYVKYDGQWLTLEEVAARAADDKQLAEYRKRRDAMIDRADDHRELARWCKKNQLTEEARVHWAKVLEFDPSDAEALAALGLQLHEGQLLTKQQIVEAKKQAGERIQAMKRWQPQMVKWRKAIETLQGHDYDFALHELRTLNDVEALPALEAIFAENVASPKADALNLALIETAGRIRSPEATPMLLRRAIQSDSEVVRVAACDQLKKRPMYAYVPQLIAAMPGKIKTRFKIFVLPGGMVLHEHEVFLEGRETDVLMTYTSTVNPADAASAMMITPQALARESRRAEVIERAALATSQKHGQLRERVSLVLTRTTGFENLDDPALWRKQYNDLHHWNATEPTKPLRKADIKVEQAFFHLPTHTKTIEHDVYRDPNGHSCFPAGTLVYTINGQKPIESIAVGDRVLSQDPNSGQLTFNAVQERTLRTVPELARISCGDSRSIVATLGHPFWVVGKGWRVVSQLASGDRVYGVNGTSTVTGVEKVPPSEVYNLVVVDSHTYFVGEAGFLVHDNSPLVETGVLIPGLAVANTKD